METYKSKRWIKWHISAVLLTIIIASQVAVRSPHLVSQASSHTQVWGIKPVLPYFALTASLSETMRAELGLSQAQFAAIRWAAQGEADNLRTLEQSSLPVIQDEDLSLPEKQAQIAASGYNQRAREIIASSQAQLESELDPESYARLVDWIERRWPVEQKLHGLASLDRTAGARSYSIYATRFDADSYIVALPDGCLKIANGGNHLCDDSGYDTGQNYSVRLSYKASVTAKVGDSGPWNVDDNYWSGVDDPQPRRLFPDLPAGMPEAQAAYFDDYNDGEDQFGRTVTAPFGIDLNRDVSIDIGLDPGINDWIDITFLWTDGWDDIQSEYVLLKSPSELEPPYTGDMCVTAWHRISGYDDHAYLTLNVNDANQSTNWAVWKPNFPSSGEYKVLAFVPDHPPVDWLCPAQEIPRDTGDASYSIQHDGGSKMVSGNQGPLANMWLDLGTYKFSKGSGAVVRLTDVTDETSYSRTVAFSAMLFLSLEYPDPTPEPTPTQAPTPTPTPAAFVWAGSGIAPPNTTISIPIGVSHLQLPGLGAASVDVQYDPALLEAVSCQPDPQGVFDSQTCDPGFEQDRINPDVLRFNLGSASGVSGNPKLAELGFRAVGPEGGAAVLDVVIQVFESPTGEPLSIPAFDGLVCIAPCQNLSYLPALLRAWILP
jgi:hypothetical protein